EGGITDSLQLDPSLNYSGSLHLVQDQFGGTQVAIGQIATVSSGTSVSNTTVSSGDFEDVFGGAVSMTVVSGGAQTVFSGGIASATLVSGGAERVYGSDTGAIVSSGGRLGVFSGGTATGATIGVGGLLNVWSGATTVSASLVGSTSFADGGDGGD